jgi:predicted metalloprotease with PDZ domain
LVDIIEPGSPADKALTKDDEIVAVNGIKVENNIDQLIGSNNQMTLSIIRFGKFITKKIECDGKSYLPRYSIKKRSDATEQEKINFQKWIKNEF